MTIHDLGTLKQIARDDGAVGVWSGAISYVISTRSSSSAARPPQQLFDGLEAYLVPATVSAPTRCIDGRGIQEDIAAHSLPASFGPQIAGGTTAAALLRRFAEAGKDDGALLTQDLRHAIGTLQAAGLGIGDHIDDHHTPNEEDTGCGAVDKMPQIVERILQPSAGAQIMTLAQALLGDRYDSRLAEDITGRLRAFEHHADGYFARREDGRYAFKQETVRLLRGASASDPIEVLHGVHQEKGLLVNTVNGLTFDRDRFAYDHDGLQLFGYDVWFVGRLAAAFFPGDPQKQQAFLLLHVFYSIAAAMILTDGSLPVLVATEA